MMKFSFEELILGKNPTSISLGMSRSELPESFKIDFTDEVYNGEQLYQKGIRLYFVDAHLIEICFLFKHKGTKLSVVDHNGMLETKTIDWKFPLNKMLMLLNYHRIDWKVENEYQTYEHLKIRLSETTTMFYYLDGGELERISIRDGLD